MNKIFLTTLLSLGICINTFAKLDEFKGNKKEDNTKGGKVEKSSSKPSAKKYFGIRRSETVVRTYERWMLRTAGIV